MINRIVLALMASLLSVSVHAAGVAPNPNGTGNIIFQPTNQDIDIISITDSGVLWDYTLYMFDEATILNHYNPNSPNFVNDQTLLSIDPVPMQVEFNGLTATHNQTGDVLELVGDSSFIFGLWNHNFNGGMWIEASYATLKYQGIQDIYDISFQFDNPNNGVNETVAFGVDLTPVPLPAGVWLFMSGLGMLVAYRKTSA